MQLQPCKVPKAPRQSNLWLWIHEQKAKEESERDKKNKIKKEAPIRQSNQQKDNK